MKVSTEVRASAAGLFALQVVTSLTAIALLSRMGPVIEELLANNADSLRAVSEMAVVLAERGAAPEAELRQRFAVPLELARNNVTEAGEDAHLAELARHYEAALGGDPRALAVSLEQIRALRDLNHHSMERAQERESRLAQAGSWAAVVLGLLGFSLTLFIVRRLTRRIVYPLTEVYDALRSYRRGDLHRRCGSRDAPAEMAAVARTINALLDERLEAAADPEAPRHEERRVLLHLLDQRDEPVLVVDGSGDILVANQRALDRLADEHTDGLKERIRLALAEDGGEDGGVVASREPVAPELWIVTLGA